MESGFKQSYVYTLEAPGKLLIKQIEWVGKKDETSLYV